MAVTVSTDLLVRHSMDSLVSTGGEGNVNAPVSVDTSILVQGTGASRARVTNPGLGGVIGEFVAVDVTGLHLYCSINNLDKVETLANGGWRIRVAADLANIPTNYGEWTVGGSETYIAPISGFHRFAIDTARAFDFQLGTPPALTSVGAIGLIANHLTASTRDTWISDSYDTGTKITILGGTTVAPGTATDIAANDKTNGRMLFKSVGGIFYVLSGLTFGDTTLGNTHVFRDANKVLNFEDQNVSDTLYTITFVSNATGVTREVSLGSKVGSGITAVGVSGFTFSSSGVHPFNLVATDTNMALNLYGCSFLNGSNTGGTVKLEHTNIDCVSCLFNSCDTITVRNNPILRKAFITNSTSAPTSAALDLGATDPAADKVRDIAFINGVNCVLLSPAANTTYNFRNFTFTGQTKKVRISAPAGRLVTINILDNGDGIANPADLDLTGGIVSGDVTIVNTVTLKVTVKDSAGLAIQSARVGIKRVDTGLQLLNDLTDINGIAQASFSFTANLAVLVEARRSGSAIEPDYILKESPQTIISAGLETTMTLDVDIVNVF